MLRSGEKGRLPELASRAERKERGRWAGEPREKREEVWGLGISFLNFFQIHFSNFQTSLKQETMHSNHDAQALIISNFIKVMFKYFKGQFYLTI
jgi:hypothetical protein